MNNALWIATVTLSIVAIVLNIKIYIKIKRQKRKLIEMKQKH
ncbi:MULTISPECIES: hypothetical protein [Massilimicrobiota]|nr:MULTISPECIES: hypothetical protein [Massilimicrobiota]